jgi:hypothetical protein
MRPLLVIKKKEKAHKFFSVRLFRTIFKCFFLTVASKETKQFDILRFYALKQSSPEVYSCHVLQRLAYA